MATDLEEEHVYQLTTEPSMATDLEKAVYQQRQPSELQPNMVSATVTDKDFSQHGEPLKYVYHH